MAGQRPAFPPALEAFVVLLAAFFIGAGVAASVAAMTAVRCGPTEFALLQGSVAALLSRMRSMAPWWPFILFVFPGAAMAMLSLHLPPWIYLVLFLFLLALYWTTFRTQVPYYPSGPAVWAAVAGLVPPDRAVRFIDIGSGFGGLVFDLGRKRPQCQVDGIEVAPLPWLVCKLKARLIGSRARFRRRDYRSQDLSHYDVVFAYLSPAAMPALWDQVCAEMRRGALLLSYEFVVPGVAPHLTMQPLADGPCLYGWRL